MKTIIRIEHNSGWGIWRAHIDGSTFIDKLSNYSQFAERHSKFPNPTWQGDIPDFKEGVHYCAFKSVEQLQEWITASEIREFLNLGFKVWMLDVTDYLEGNYQIAYTKGSIVSSKDISSLFV